MTREKTINHETSLNDMPALDSNRPREEWDLSHVKLDDASPTGANKKLTHDDEVVDLTNVLKASMEPADEDQTDNNNRLQFGNNSFEGGSA